MDLTTPVEGAFVAELTRTLPPGLAGRARVRFCEPAGKDPVATALAIAAAPAGAAIGRTGVLTSTVTGHGSGPSTEDRAPGAARPAGTVLEPVRGEAGVLPAPDARMREMRRATAERSVPLIVDETETGVGRTGAFWAVEHSGIAPDVMVLSGAIGGGLPLAAVVYRDDLEPGERTRSAAINWPWPRARPPSPTYANTVSPTTPRPWEAGHSPDCEAWPRSSPASSTSGGAD